MDTKEIEKQLKLTYFELVDYLQKKYGLAKKSYFATPECKSVSEGVRRTSQEGLYCHHVKEYKEGYLLSTSAVARTQPFEYQQPENLVYANVLEHLILHLKIEEETGSSPGFLDITKQINDFWGGYKFKQEYYNKVYNLIKDNFNDYIEILKKYISLSKQENIYEAIYRGVAVGNVKSILDALNIEYKIIDGELKTLYQIEEEKQSEKFNQYLLELEKIEKQRKHRDRTRSKRVYNRMLAQADRIKKGKK